MAARASSTCWWTASRSRPPRTRAGKTGGEMVLTRLLLHLAIFLLLCAAVMVKRPIVARSLIGGVGAVWLLRALLTDDTTDAILGFMLVLLAAAVVGRRLWRDRAVRFTPDEQHMMDSL